jgi:hypothetical protein
MGYRILEALQLFRSLRESFVSFYILLAAEHTGQRLGLAGK